MPVVGRGGAFEVEVNIVAKMSANTNAFDFVSGSNFFISKQALLLHPL